MYGSFGCIYEGGGGVGRYVWLFFGCIYGGGEGDLLNVHMAFLGDYIRSRRRSDLLQTCVALLGLYKEEEEEVEYLLDFLGIYRLSICTQDNDFYIIDTQENDVYLRQ